MKRLLSDLLFSLSLAPFASAQLILTLPAVLLFMLGTANFAYAEKSPCTNPRGCVEAGTDYYTPLVPFGEPDFRPSTRVFFQRLTDIPIGVAPSSDNMSGFSGHCHPSEDGFFYEFSSQATVQAGGKMMINGTISGGTFSFTIHDQILSQFKDPSCSQLNSVCFGGFESNTGVWSHLPAPGEMTVPGVDGANDNPLANLWSNLDPLETNFFPVTPVVLNGSGGCAAYVIPLAPTGLFLQVAIEINPPSVAPVPIAPGNRGVFPVAILSTPTFDATTVDSTTVRFGPNAAQNVSPPAITDVNGDGLPDFVLYFDSNDTGIACGDTVAVLTGLTKATQSLAGAELIQTCGQ